MYWGLQQLRKKALRDMGGTLSSEQAHRISVGAETLSLRVKHCSATALALARWLEQHPKIERVHYPGLASHRDHAVAKRQMSGFGGVVSFEVRGTLESASKFIDALRIPYIAPSLGGVETLVEQPTVISYWDKTPEERQRFGITDTLVRFSCGIEDAEDLVADLDQALAQA